MRTPVRELYDTQKIRARRKNQGIWGLLCGLGIEISIATALPESSPHKGDRTASGPGPPRSGPGPGPINKSYSVETAHPPTSPTQHRGSICAGRKAAPAKTTDDVTNKANKNQAGYELSQDLLDKQLEMLERKYGGVRARSAALTIQRAFRRYTMMKKFAAITTAAKAEKRLSRRFHTVDFSSGVMMGGGGVEGGEWFPPGLEEAPPPEVVIQNNFASMYKELSESLHVPGEGPRLPKGPSRSMSVREKSTAQSPFRGIDLEPISPVSEHNGLCQTSSTPIPPPEQRRADSTPSPRVPSVDQDGQESDHSDTYSHLDDSSIYYTPAGTMTPGQDTRRSAQVTPVSRYQHYQEDGDTSRYFTPRESVSEDSGISMTHMIHHECRLTRECAIRRTTPPQFRGRPGGATHPRNHPHIHPVTAYRRAPPPDVPRRTSSISSTPPCNKPCCTENIYSELGEPTLYQQRGLLRTPDQGSLSSVQSSGSDSSAPGEGSPVWQRKPRLANISEGEPRYQAVVPRYPVGGQGYSVPPYRAPPEEAAQVYKVSEVVRKRQYRVGLNLFNKRPEKGVAYLMRRNFLEHSPQAVARFLITRKGLSKQMIGEYLGNLQSPFNMAVLECFSHELDLSNQHVDVALRKFQTYFRLPGEAQKIERLMEVFGQRYCQCNPTLVAALRNPADTVFVLAFAIIMLNTDLHTPNIKPERRMKVDDFIRNLRGIDDGSSIDRDLLVGIYERIKSGEFKPGSDHVTQVMKVQQTIVGKKPNLALPHRRLVCYCRLYEIIDINKKERPGLHQREVFLFNDLLVITKIFSKKKNSITYTFRQSITLAGLVVSLFQVPHYEHVIRLSQRVDGKVVAIFNARNEHDRSKFVEDLRESICEMDEMENLRIEAELDKQKAARARTTENRDSGVADMMDLPANGNKDCNGSGRESVKSSPETGLKRSALSNSLLDIHEQSEKPQRRGSVGSLDSGMSISFQSTSTSTVSRDSSPQNMQPIADKQNKITVANQHQSFLGGLFNKKEKERCKTSKTDLEKCQGRSTDV